MAKKTATKEPERLTLESVMERLIDLKTRYCELENRVKGAIGTITSDKPERERLTAEFAQAVMTGDAETVESIAEEAKALFPARQKAVAAVGKLENDFEKIEAERQALAGECSQLFDARTLQFRKTLSDCGPGPQLNHAQAMLDEAASMVGKATHPGTVPPNLQRALDQLRAIASGGSESAESGEVVQPGPIPGTARAVNL